MRQLSVDGDADPACFLNARPPHFASCTYWMNVSRCVHAVAACGHEVSLLHVRHSRLQSFVMTDAAARVILRGLLMKRWGLSAPWNIFPVVDDQLHLATCLCTKSRSRRWLFLCSARMHTPKINKNWKSIHIASSHRPNLSDPTPRTRLVHSIGLSQTCFMQPSVCHSAPPCLLLFARHQTSVCADLVPATSCFFLPPQKASCLQRIHFVSRARRSGTRWFFFFFFFSKPHLFFFFFFFLKAVLAAVCLKPSVKNESGCDGVLPCYR